MNISNHTFCENALSNYSNMHSNALFEIFYFQKKYNNNYNKRLTSGRINEKNNTQTKQIAMILKFYLFWNECKCSEYYWSLKQKLLNEEI